MTTEEKALAQQHSQLGSEDYFKREYPLVPDEAFMASQFDSFVTSDIVMKARKTTDI